MTEAKYIDMETEDMESQRVTMILSHLVSYIGFRREMTASGMSDSDKCTLMKRSGVPLEFMRERILSTALTTKSVWQSVDSFGIPIRTASPAETLYSESVGKMNHES